MAQHRITSLETRDVRFPLEHGAGSDAVRSGAEYTFATTLLVSAMLEREHQEQDQVEVSLDRNGEVFSEG
jgi:hypothetical protein